MATPENESLVRANVAKLNGLLLRANQAANAAGVANVRGTGFAAPLHETLAMISVLSSGQLHGAPDGTIADLSATLSDFGTKLEQVSAMTPVSIAGDPGMTAFAEACRAADKVKQVAMPLVAYLSTRDRGALESVEKELQQRSTTAHVMADQISELLNTVRTRELEATGILQSMWVTAGKAGVAKHAQAFGQIAQAHSREARIWLGGTIAVAIGTDVVWHLISKYPLDENARTAVIAQ
jgi:hypothetical protein